MQLQDVMTELAAMGSPNTVKIYRNHGADGPMFGVKVGDLKKILRKIKGNQELALELWDTGNSDAMYLASLVADGSRMTKAQLNRWATQAWWYMLSEYAVPFVAAEHPDAFSVASKWIAARKANVQSSGWSTYAAALSITDDASIDLEQVGTLLEEVIAKLDKAEGRVRYTMNGFVISVGTYVPPLLKAAQATAKKIGKVEVNLGQTACKVPLATEAIAKVVAMNRVGRKRKTVKC